MAKPNVPDETDQTESDVIPGTDTTVYANAAAQHPPAANQEEDVLAPFPLGEYPDYADGRDVNRLARDLYRCRRERNALAALLLEAEEDARQRQAADPHEEDPWAYISASAIHNIVTTARERITNIRQEDA